MTTYFLVGFEGFGDHEYIEASRRPFKTVSEAIEALRDEIGEEDLYEALELSLGGEMIFWKTDDLGFTIERETTD